MKARKFKTCSYACYCDSIYAYVDIGMNGMLRVTIFYQLLLSAIHL